MTTPDTLPPEESLDPEDWQAARALGHRMVDDMLEHMRRLRERPVWRRMPDEVKARFTAPVPKAPSPPQAVYEEFREHVLPWPVGNDHPRFWGWVLGTGTVSGAFADFLASAMNTNTGGLDHHSANHVEMQVIAWLREMLAYPRQASGLLTSGCSAANLVALAVARNARAGFDLRRRGLGAATRPLTLYASEEVHSSIQKSVELLGLGSEALRRVPVDGDFRIDLAALRAAIARDRAAGLQPFCVVGAAGTTNTGAVDDLAGLADICRDESLWFHVDGAFGAWAALDPESRHLVAGMERADSLAFDLHKWMYMPYDIACVLVRDERAHREAFALTPAYLAHDESGQGMTGGDLPWFSDYGFELSRGFKALKAWMSLKEHGADRHARLVRQNIEQARHLAALVEATPELELAAPVALNIVCFRYVRAGLNDAALDAINRRIVTALQESGVAVVSGTTVRGRYVIRVANTNHRSRREDFERLVQEVIRTGVRLPC